MNKIDVVYVLGSGSRWEDNEIRFSIRSFQQNFKDLGKIVVVGQFPRFAQNILHIPFKDDMNINKDARMIKKLLAACTHPEVSENFIFATDDEILLAPLTWEEFCANHEGEINLDLEADAKDHYRNGAANLQARNSKWFTYVKNTREALESKGLPFLNYDKSHCPQPINKGEFIELINQFDYLKTNYTCSNLYQNSTTRFPQLDVSDLVAKIYGPIKDPIKLLYLLNGKLYLNFSDGGLTWAMKQVLKFLFPNKTNFETTDMKRENAEIIIQWLQEPSDYMTGYSLYVRFGKNLALKRMFAKGETKYSREKLMYELTKIAGLDTRKPIVDMSKFVKPAPPAAKANVVVTPTAPIDKKVIERTKENTNAILKSEWQYLSEAEKAYFLNDESLFEEKRTLMLGNGDIHKLIIANQAKLKAAKTNDERKAILAELEKQENAWDATWKSIDSFPETSNQQPATSIKEPATSNPDAVAQAIKNEKRKNALRSNISRTEKKLEESPNSKKKGEWNHKLEGWKKELEELEAKQ